MPVDCGGRYAFHRTTQAFAAIAALLFNVLLTSTPSFGNTVFQEKFTRALRPELRVIYSQAIAAFRAADFETASQKYSDLHERGRSSRDDLGVSLGFFGLAEVHFASQNYVRAENSLNEALPFIARSGSKELQAWWYAVLGYIHLQMKNPQRAIEAFQNALSIGETLLQHATENEKAAIVSVRAEVFSRKAAAHEELAQFGDAVNAMLMAGEDFERVSEKAKAALSYWRAAILLRNKINKSQEALGVYERAAKLFNELRNQEGLLWTRLGMASAYRDLGRLENFEKAARVLEEVLELAKQAPTEKLIGVAHFELAANYEQFGEFEKALTHYQVGLAHDREVGGGEYANPNYYSYLYTKAKIYRHLGRYEEAIENLLAILPTLREKRNQDEAQVLTTLAEIFNWIADSGRAFQYYKQALELYKESGDTINQINVLSALGELWVSDVVSLGEATEYFNSARKLLNTYEGLDLLTIREKDGSFEIPAGKTLLDIIREKLSKFEPWSIMVAGNLYQRWGRIAGIAGQIDDAILLLKVAGFYHMALPFDRDVGIEQGKDCYFLGKAYRQRKDLKTALEYFQFCEALARELRTPEIHWVYSGLAQTYAGLGDFQNAIEHYKKGLSLLESIEGQQFVEGTKIGVIAGAIYAYHGLVPLLLNNYQKTGHEQYLSQAFEYTERLKARAFREMYTVSRAARVGGEFGDLAAKEEKTRIEMRIINERLQNVGIRSAEGSRLLDHLEKLRKSLSELRRQGAMQNKPLAQVFAGDPVTIRQVQSVIAPDTVLLEYSISGRQITLWIITKDDVGHAVIDVFNESVLEEYIKTLRVPLIGSEDISKHVSLGQELYRTLFGEINHYLQGKKRLIIAPDGSLYYLPFETLIETSLQGETRRHTTLADVPYLIKRYEVSYIPSASVFVTQSTQERKEKQPQRLPFVAFGDPVYSEEAAPQTAVVDSRQITNVALRGSKFQRLEFSGEEVRRIAGIWNVAQDSEHINLRQRASVKRVKETDLSKYRVLHFASHAVLGDKIELASQPALILSEEDGKDSGLLQFSDILELKLNAELVVLSACETGLGQLRNGEGIVGITRAFFYAGASSAVVSLWKVQDQSTSIFMESFYSNLKQAKSKAEALREAKIKLMTTTVNNFKATGGRQSLAAPFFWAPFILAGDAGPIVQ